MMQSDFLSVSPQTPNTFEQIRNNAKINQLILGANEVMLSMGFTEHGHRHVSAVAETTRRILTSMRLPEREIELAMIAAYMHDIGNAIARLNHPMHGAAMAFTLLNEMNMEMSEIVAVLGAIGNHEELTGGPVSTISAAVIIADKSDVHFSRVQNPIFESFDIHDRVNYAVQANEVIIREPEKRIELDLTIDSTQASVMEYFEIFLHRMVMCRTAAERLGYRFSLNINGTFLE